MPIYGYTCDQCSYEFEITQSMKDDCLVECPECKQESLQRKIYVPLLHIVGEPTTLGHLAARNTSRMGHYEYEDRMAQRKKRVQKASDKLCEQTGGKNIERGTELPWYRSGKMEGLPRRESPLTPNEANKLAKELGITDTEPRKSRKKEK
jgi:putative FmdB family regulatory protein